MSDATSTPAVASRDYHIRVTEDMLEETKSWTTKDWRTQLYYQMEFHLESLRAIVFIRYLLLAALLFGANHLMHHFGMPTWAVGVCMAVLVAAPLLWFKHSMRDLRRFLSPTAIARFFEITYTKKGKILYVQGDRAESALRDLFKLQAKPKGKKNKTATDPFPSVVNVAGNIAQFRVTAWGSVVMFVLALILTHGTMLNGLTAVLLTFATLATALYRNMALKPLHRLMSAAEKAGLAEEGSDVEDEDDDEGLSILDSRDVNDDTPESGNGPKKSKGKKSRKDDAPEGLAGTVTDEQILHLVGRHNHHQPLTNDELRFLEGLFPAGIPTAETLRKMMLSVGPDAPETASAATGSTPDNTAPLAPLPQRTSPRHRRGDSDSTTGTPAHGTPVPAPAGAVHSAPVPTPAPTDYYDPNEKKDSVPAPAYTPQQLDELFTKWLAVGDEGLTLEENVAIAPYKNKR